MKEIKLKTDHLRTNKDAAHRLRGDITDLQEKEKTYRHQIRDLEDLISAKDKASLYIIDTIILHLLHTEQYTYESYQAAIELDSLDHACFCFYSCVLLLHLQALRMRHDDAHSYIMHNAYSSIHYLACSAVFDVYLFHFEIETFLLKKFLFCSL